MTRTFCACIVVAAVGMGIDALIRGDREIYRRGNTARFTMIPVIDRSARGAAISLTW